MLHCEMDFYLSYEKGSQSGVNIGNSRKVNFLKKTQCKHGKAAIEVLCNRAGNSRPVVVPKHQSCGLSIERSEISLYAKGISVSYIESKNHEIYDLNLSTSCNLAYQQQG